MNLNKEDYLKILDFYNIKYTNKTSIKNIKSKAEKILAEKLCRCIKKVKPNNPDNESRAIGICRNSVLTRKKVKAGRFSCKNKAKFFKNKTARSKLIKITKNM